MCFLQDMASDKELGHVRLIYALISLQSLGSKHMHSRYCPTTMPSEYARHHFPLRQKRCPTSIRLPQSFDSRVTQCVTSQMKRLFS